jgi:hypothetical protein
MQGVGKQLKLIYRFQTLKGLSVTKIAKIAINCDLIQKTIISKKIADFLGKIDRDFLGKIDF